jgi:hypothetical protein
LKIRHYSENNRGIQAKRDIAEDEQILIVPHQCLITIEDVAQKTPFTRKLVE